jgi:haloacid dehalogenase superfamily, subfamily IA, variant 3 with third motif having DD or ED
MPTVIFDLGGVLINWVPERAYEPVLPADQIPAFMERVGFEDWNRRNDGEASIEGSQEELAARFPADAETIRAYRRNFLLTITEGVPGTAAVLAELNAAGVPTMALTNWAGDMFAQARARFGILRRFFDIVVSGDEGMVKPHREIFELACARASIEPADAIFIDDTAHNIDAARTLGMTALVFTNAEALRADLVQLGLLGERLPVTEPVYHLATRSHWEQAVSQGRYPWSSRDADYLAEGFVHCSFAGQLAGTRARFYGDLTDDDLVLLRLDPDGLPVVVEDGYPHLFAELPLDRVTQASLPA